MKTIIVTTDYSDASRNATWYAAALAQRTGAKMLLYHAFFVPVVSTEVPVYLPGVAELTEVNAERLSVMAHELKRQFGVEVAFITDSVPVVDALPRLVAKHQADLVVMAMRGLDAIDQRVFGSTTVAVIRQVEFPVLIIPESAHYQEPTQIMFACDYETLTDNNPLTPLKELAYLFNANVLVLHVDRADDNHTTKKMPDIESMLEGIKHQYVFLDEEDVLKGIDKGVHVYQPDMLVMVPREHSFWDVLLNRSTTRKVAFHTHIPLLTIPNPKQGGSSFIG